MNVIDLIADVRSGVAQIILERGNEDIGSGSAILVEGGLVTNSHNIRSCEFDVILIRFADTNGNLSRRAIRLLQEDCYKAIAAESVENDKDYVYLSLSEPEFNGRHVFEFVESSTLSVGEQVVFLGFPFRIRHLTSHIGYVSSIHEDNGVEVIQIDGSVNSGNSGGPLLDLKTGKVAGIVTRAETGLLKEQFDKLMEMLREHTIALEKNAEAIITYDADSDAKLTRAIKGYPYAIKQIAKQITRSANVGIGFAFSAKYVRDRIDALRSQ